MTDVRLTALNPVDSQVYPVACNTSGELLVADGGPDLTVTGDLTVDGDITVDGTATIGTVAIVTDANQNVAIGTNTPRTKLDVNGTILTTSIPFTSNQDEPYLIAGTTSYTGATTNWGTYGFQHRIKTNSLGVPRITIDTHEGEVFVISNAERVGILTSDPTSEFEVNGTGTFSTVKVGGQSASPNIQLNNNGTATFQGDVSAPNITSLTDLIGELTTKVETLMSLNSRQVDISTDAP